SSRPSLGQVRGVDLSPLGGGPGRTLLRRPRRASRRGGARRPGGRPRRRAGHRSSNQGARLGEKTQCRVNRWSRRSRRGSGAERWERGSTMSESKRWDHTKGVFGRHHGGGAMGSDGQVTLGTTVMKQTAAKIRRLKGGEVLAGFAGSSADAFALFSRFETKVDEFRGNLERAAIELAKDWRTDKMLRQLEALLIVA